MTRKTLLAATALALSAIAGLPASAQNATPAQPGQRMQIAGGMANRVIRQVMIAPDGGGIDIIYDMPAGAPVSKRVLRLENVNGMLEVIYDTAMPRSMALGSGGTPRLTAKGDGGYEVTYEK
jgi:hypothetical protein